MGVGVLGAAVCFAIRGTNCRHLGHREDRVRGFELWLESKAGTGTACRAATNSLKARTGIRQKKRALTDQAL